MEMEFITNAEVISVKTEISKKVNGKEFQKCVVKHTSGKLEGKTFFANRTLGEGKEIVNVGDKITCYNRVENGQLFSEISTSTQVDNLESILAGLETKENATEVVDEL